MANYCDSKELERIWYLWILAKRTPSLDCFRKAKVLWTRPKEKIPNGKNIYDPNCSKYDHVLALSSPITFSSIDGNIKGLYRDMQSIIDLQSDDPHHLLDTDILAQSLRVIPQLKQDGYVLEHPVSRTWSGLLLDINKICVGICSKFNLPPECDRDELINDVLLQVAQKLNTGKLKYSPGRAPVFNLLTTTIIRCVYSVLGSNTRHRKNIAKLLLNAQDKKLPRSRSLGQV